MKSALLLCLAILLVLTPLAAAAVELDQVPEAFRVESDAPPVVQPAQQESDELAQLRALIADMERQIQALEAGMASPEPTVEEPEPEPLAGEMTLTDELYDYRLQIDGSVYALPMSFDALAQDGWRFDNAMERERMVYPDQYESILLRRRDPFDSRTMWVMFRNTGIDAHPAVECSIAGIEISYSEDEAETAKSEGFQLNNLTLAKGVALLQSTADDVAAAYGTPTREYDYGYALEWGYDQDYTNCYTFQFGPSRLLVGVSIWNFAAVDMDEAPVSSEPPASYAAYEPPSEMGDIRSLVFEIYGDLYRLPAPITAFEANGWVPVDIDQDVPALASHQSGTISLERGEDRMSLGIVNLEDKAVLTQYACVNSAYIYYEGDPLNAQVVLPGGIRVGSSYDEVLEAYSDWIAYASRYEDGIYMNVYCGDRMAITLTLDSATMTVVDWSFDVKPGSGYAQGD